MDRGRKCRVAWLMPGDKQLGPRSPGIFYLGKVDLFSRQAQPRVDGWGSAAAPPLVSMLTRMIAAAWRTPPCLRGVRAPGRH